MGNLDNVRKESGLINQHSGKMHLLFIPENGRFPASYTFCSLSHSFMEYFYELLGLPDEWISKCLMQNFV